MTRFFWTRFIGSWFIALVTLQLSRFVFFLNLSGYFEATGSEIFHSFLFGTAFDAVTIAYLLGPYFIVLPFLKKGAFQNVATAYYIIMLGVMNLLNCIDAEFFKFTARRSTDDLFEFAFLSDDLFNIAPNLLSHFWYLLVVFIVIMLLALWAIYQLTTKTETAKTGWMNGLALIPIAFVLVLAARGGIRPIPLTIIDAGMTDSPELNSIVLSTPFTIIKTWGKPELARLSYPKDEIADVNPIINPDSTELRGRFEGDNVIIIIVESLSTEYVGALNGLNVGYTPFVDSLCSISMVFENGFANGHRSIEGIPAVVASIPTLMYEPYTTSRYGGNNVTSMAKLLGEEGYYTSFMHGGNTNSMNFQSFAGQAGYQQFYDRNDYPFPNEHYDGFWGISDHYFLNNCVEKFSEFKKPFFSSIFTLSSHHPYSLPEDYQDRFPKGTLPIHESIGYADEALRQFFENASKTDWYANTLFVITADHTSLSEHPQYQTKLGSLRIPVIFFHPNDTLITATRQEVMQQIDIMPTILGLIGYEKPFFSFGVNALDEHAEHTSVAFKHDQYQLYRNDQLICFDGEKTTFVYDVKSDELLQNNLMTDGADLFSDNERYLKAFIENYSVALNDNQMTVETWVQPVQ
ncbi:MAG: sulfatase-like hydrolase/transferase [Flavobacteriales bacterium]|nr:sulfatase-like hydrolase/transferase [Flavobacteriales bacterium]